MRNDYPSSRGFDLAQTFEDFELIILNDGSTDSTQSIVVSYTDPRIRLINKKNSGVASTLNLGLKEARGEYIWRHDADDVSLPQKLEKEIAFLRTHPESFVRNAGSLHERARQGSLEQRQPKDGWLGLKPIAKSF